eukprot:scaffold1411_cov252-Pinguiococcus_pyrenoidosus.AAC.22
MQLAVARALHDKILRTGGSANEVHAADEGLPILVQPRHHGLHEVRAEALLVEQRREHRGEGLRRHLALFAEFVQVHPEAQEVAQRLHVSPQPREADNDAVVELEHLLEVTRDGHLLVPP